MWGCSFGVCDEEQRSKDATTSMGLDYSEGSALLPWEAAALQGLRRRRPANGSSSRWFHGWAFGRCAPGARPTVFPQHSQPIGAKCWQPNSRRDGWSWVDERKGVAFFFFPFFFFFLACNVTDNSEPSPTGYIELACCKWYSVSCTPGLTCECEWVCACVCVTSPDEAAGVEGLLDLEEDVAFLLIICDKWERAVMDARKETVFPHLSVRSNVLAVSQCTHPCCWTACVLPGNCDRQRWWPPSPGRQTCPSLPVSVSEEWKGDVSLYCGRKGWREVTVNWLHFLSARVSQSALQWPVIHPFTFAHQWEDARTVQIVYYQLQFSIGPNIRLPWL